MTDPREQFPWPGRPAWVASVDKIGGMILIAVEDFLHVELGQLIALGETFGTRAVDVEPESGNDGSEWLTIRIHNITKMPGAES